MKLLILSILLASCSQYQHRDKLISVNYLVGYKCPDNYYYRLSDKLCYPITVNKPLEAINRTANAVAKVKVKKPIRTAKINCSNVFKIINQCSGVR